MGLVDRRRSKVELLVRPQLEPGEQISATLSMAWSGPTSPWLMAIVVGFFIGYLVGFRIRALVVTDRRILIVAKTYWLGRPKAIEQAEIRAATRLLEYKAPGLFGKLVLTAGAVTMKFYPPRIHRSEADAVVQALGDTARGMYDGAA